MPQINLLISSKILHLFLFVCGKTTCFFKNCMGIYSTLPEVPVMRNESEKSSNGVFMKKK